MAASANILPDQFWVLTPYEFKLVMDGRLEKHDVDMRTLAWLQANLINALRQVKRGTPPVRIESIYRPSNQEATPSFASAEDFKEYMRKRAKEY